MNRLKEKRTCMADGCGRSFIMTHGRQRFCKDPECIARREKKLAAKHMRTFRNKKTVAAANDRVLPKCNKAIFEVCGSNSFCDGCNRQTRKKDDKDLFKPVVKKKEVDPVIPACTLHKGCVYEGLCTPCRRHTGNPFDTDYFEAPPLKEENGLPVDFTFPLCSNCAVRKEGAHNVCMAKYKSENCISKIMKYLNDDSVKHIEKDGAPVGEDGSETVLPHDHLDDVNKLGGSSPSSKDNEIGPGEAGARAGEALKLAMISLLKNKKEISLEPSNEICVRAEKILHHANKVKKALIVTIICKGVDVGFVMDRFDLSRSQAFKVMAIGFYKQICNAQRSHVSVNQLNIRGFVNNLETFIR